MGLIGSILKTTAKVAIGVPLMVVGGIIEGAGKAARTQRDAGGLSDKELVNRYNNSTGAEKVGYAQEIKSRTGR